VAKPPESSDHFFLVVVVEFSESSAGRVVEALKQEKVAALALPHAQQLPIAYEHMRPRVFVVDAEAPGRREVAMMRTMREKDRTGSLVILLLGAVDEPRLPVEACELADAYVRKPMDWKKVARTVVQLANKRKPPSDVVVLPKA